MSINLTLFAQIVVFALLVWFTMRFVWPMLREAMDDRERKIADGLAAAERGRSDLESARHQVEQIVQEARSQAMEIIDQANRRAAEIVDEGRVDGQREKERQLAAAQAEIEQTMARARDELRGQVAGIAVAAAEKILSREIDAQAHRDLLERLAADI